MVTGELREAVDAKESQLDRFGPYHGIFGNCAFLVEGCGWRQGSLVSTDVVESRLMPADKAAGRE